MRPATAFIFLVTLAMLWAMTTGVGGQLAPVRHATDFTSVEYYEPPNQQQMKSRLSGAEAQPAPGGLLDIKQLRLETFAEDGKTQMVVTAPECVYDTFNEIATSSGYLRVQSGDGKFRTDGNGFLWRETNSCLLISNSVRTVIDGMPALPLAGQTAAKKK